jgi:hypothetical protein
MPGGDELPLDGGESVGERTIARFGEITASMPVGN